MRIRLLVYGILYRIFNEIELFLAFISGFFLGFYVVFKIKVLKQSIDIPSILNNVMYKKGICGRIADYFLSKMMLSLFHDTLWVVLNKPKPQVDKEVKNEKV